MTNTQYFWRLGHKYTNHKITNGSLFIGMRRFKSMFGVSPSICFKIWKLLENNIESNIQPVHLLWALCFLKLYNTESVNKAIFRTNEKTFRKYTWIVLGALAELDVIKFENRFENALPEQFIFTSIDGVDFKINEPRPFSPDYYSHKFNGPGLKYEVALSLINGEIVWINGGYPCGAYSDLKLAREAYIYQVNQGELTFADRGYRDSNFFVLPNDANKAQHRIIMARHETINKRLRHFKILSNTFRHSIENHNIVFQAVANITQLVLRHEEPLFSIL